MKKRYLKKNHRDFFIGVFTGILFLFLGILTFFLIQKYQQAHYQVTHPHIETKKTIVKELPPEIKKELKLATPSATLPVPILLYHYVEYIQDKDDKLRAELNVTPAVFDSQVQTLKDAGYIFMTAKDMGDVLDGKET